MEVEHPYVLLKVQIDPHLSLESKNDLETAGMASPYSLAHQSSLEPAAGTSSGKSVTPGPVFSPVFFPRQRQGEVKKGIEAVAHVAARKARNLAMELAAEHSGDLAVVSLEVRGPRPVCLLIRGQCR